MSKRDKLYKIGENVEIDEDFFDGKETGGKRDLGSEKAKEAVALQVDKEYTQPF